MTLEGSLDQHRLYQLQVLGQALESGQPTIRFWRQERLPVRVEYLSEPLVIEQLGKALKLAEGAARVLQKSIRSLGQLLLAPDTHRHPDRKDVDNLTDGFGAIPHYWSQLEAPFKRLLIDLPSDRRTDEHDDVYYGEKELPRWARTLHDAATSAFTIVTRSLDTSSRSLKAVAAVEPQFRAGLRAALPDNFQTSTGGTQ